MPEKKTLAEIGEILGWGANGAYFNSKQPGFPEPEMVEGGTFADAVYSLEDVISWDHLRPMR